MLRRLIAILIITCQLLAVVAEPRVTTTTLSLLPPPSLHFEEEALAPNSLGLNMGGQLLAHPTFTGLAEMSGILPSGHPQSHSGLATPEPKIIWINDLT